MVAILAGMLLSSCGGTTKPQEDYTATFKKAKDNTQELIEYQYDFELTASIKYKDALSFSPATYKGTTYVNTSAPETQFLQKRELSGLLVFDSTTYIYNNGTDLIKISADEDKDFSVINHETASSVYDFDKHNFGYILKNLDEEGFLKAKYNNGKYELSLHTNFSQDSILNVLNFIDSKLILKAINKFTTKEWGVGLSVNSWATIDDNSKCLKVFHFDAGISIKDTFDIRFNFEQTFTKYSGVTINVPTFANTKITENEVKSELSTVSAALSNSMNAPTSYYNFKTKTTVDHGVSKSNPLGLAVDSTTQGIARREVKEGVTYFNNKIEVDSDYKNNDQLGDLVKDYNSYRAKLSNGDVYDVLDPTIGFNQYTLLENYNESDIDEQYMLPKLSGLNYDNVKVVKKTTDTNSNTVYKFGLSSDGVKDLLNQYNKSVRIDFNRVTIFDIYKIESDFNAKKANYTITVNSENKVVVIDLELKGFYVEKDSDDQVKFGLKVQIDYDWTKSYTAVSKKEDIDNK